MDKKFIFRILSHLQSILQLSRSETEIHSLGIIPTGTATELSHCPLKEDNLLSLFELGDQKGADLSSHCFYTHPTRLLIFQGS